MKIGYLNKQKLNNMRRCKVVRVRFEPDYDHEAWLSDTVPTVSTVPDAFYKVSTPAYPVEPSTSVRRKPHSSLTARKLRKRLYQAGVRGIEAKRIFAEIMAGEPIGESGEVAIPMSWRGKALQERFGHRVARAVLRFVAIQFVVLDEFSYYAPPAMEEFIQMSMRRCRKYSATSISVSQVWPAVPAKTVRRITFRY